MFAMITQLLWDLDGTILDFNAAEHNALQDTFASFRLGPCTEQMIADYSALNDSYWKRLERGEITKPRLVIQRFEEFFASLGLDTSIAPAFNQEYQLRLGDTICYRDNSYTLIQELHPLYQQYIVTNGPVNTQYRKLKNAKLLPYFDKIFISDEIGAEKPAPAFFDYVFQHTASHDKQDFLIIGDSLTSDIKGGIQAGIRTCWYNPANLPVPEHMKPTYVISDLQMLKDILEIR